MHVKKCNSTFGKIMYTTLPRLDLIVKEELRKDAKLLFQKLVTKVDRGVHDTCAMSPYRVGNVPDGDGVEVLVLASGLYKNLMIEVV